MIFNESGVYPGIPGQFAGCHVTVNGDGTLAIRPRAQQPHVTDAPAADIPAPAPAEKAAMPENTEEAD